MNNRRFVIRIVAGIVGLILMAGCAQVVPQPAAGVEAEVLLPTVTPEPEPSAVTTEEQPAGGDAVASTSIPCDGVPTSPNQEGPFYSPGSPPRSSLLEEGMPGTPIRLFGHVFDQECNPLSGAKLDFWLADVEGEYDNSGYRLRGHLLTNESGSYALDTIEPTSYTGRPPHIHVKVFAQDGRELLTTQIYFAGSEGSSDVTSSPDLLATYLDADESGRKQALFNFVVQN